MVNFSALPSAALIRALVVFILLALCLPAAGQAPAWQSARAVAAATAAATSNYSDVITTAVDAAGNVYLAGAFSNTVMLGSTTLTSLGSRDVFVTKFNPASNQFVWAQRAGGTDDDLATTLTVSGTSVYVAGAFRSPTAGFGPITLTTVVAANVFVAKLTDAGSTGSFVWAQQAGGLGTASASALAISGTSVYLAGYFISSTAGFGPITLTNAGPNGSADGFVAKLTDAGTTGSFAWVQQAGGTGYDYTTALAVSGGSVYVAGYFGSPTVGFGVTTLTNVGSNGSSDVFVAKLTDAGSTGGFAWAQRAGGVGSDYANALVVSGTNVYIAGAFYSLTAGFGPATLTNVDATAGASDVYVAKLTDAGPTGSFVWAQQAGGPGNDTARALVVRGTSVYVTGDFISPTAGFGPATLTSAGLGDVFVAKLTDAGPTGSFAWAQRAGGTGNDRAIALAVSGTGVYVAGYFQSSTADFGAISLSNPTPNANLGFLASLTDPTLTATTAALPREPATLFPNPARHAATLRLPAGATPAPLTLTDALGRPVRRYPAPAGLEATLDLRGLPAGLYLLRSAGPARRLAVE